VTRVKPPPTVTATQLGLGSEFQSLASMNVTQSRLSAPPVRLASISVPVDPSFDVGQALREIKPHVGHGAQITFDWRHLELAHEYMGHPRDLDEGFVTERGGLVSLATPMGVFRAQACITRWAKSRNISVSFTHIAPQPGSPARRLYDVLDVERVIRRFKHPKLALAANVQSAQAIDSRYVSPIVMVDEKSKPTAIVQLVAWIEAARKAGDFRFDLIQLLPEIVTNIVNHSVAGAGSVLLAIWPLGEVDVLWSNQIGKAATDRRSADLFDGDPDVVAERILKSEGSGMFYVLNTLLPRYSGTLGVNFHGADIVIYSGRRFELFHPGRRTDDFVADSVLFDLKLYTDEARRSA
jgi:hypothetical protein